MITIANEYIRFYNYAEQHDVDFYNFIVLNEDILRDSGADTFSFKQIIQNERINRVNTISIMKVSIENEKNRLLQQQQLEQEQQQQIMDILYLLSAFL